MEMPEVSRPQQPSWVLKPGEGTEASRLQQPSWVLRLGEGTEAEGE